jgi:hypothetical protein
MIPFNLDAVQVEIDYLKQVNALVEALLKTSLEEDLHMDAQYAELIRLILIDQKDKDFMQRFLQDEDNTDPVVLKNRVAFLKQMLMWAINTLCQKINENTVFDNTIPHYQTGEPLAVFHEDIKQRLTKLQSFSMLIECQRQYDKQYHVDKYKGYFGKARCAADLVCGPLAATALILGPVLFGTGWIFAWQPGVAPAVTRMLMFMSGYLMFAFSLMYQVIYAMPSYQKNNVRTQALEYIHRPTEQPLNFSRKQNQSELLPVARPPVSSVPQPSI